MMRLASVLGQSVTSVPRRLDGVENSVNINGGC